MEVPQCSATGHAQKGKRGAGRDIAFSILLDNFGQSYLRSVLSTPHYLLFLRVSLYCVVRAPDAVFFSYLTEPGYRGCYVTATYKIKRRVSVRRTTVVSSSSLALPYRRR